MPFTPSQYQELREAIIAKVPEIIELKFGCRFLVGNEVHVLVSMGSSGGYTSGILHGNGKDFWGLQSYQQSFLDEHRDDIIGRPITLQDAVYTLSKKYGPEFFDHVITTVDLWDLTKTLEGQSDEVKSFLHSVLCQK